MNAVWYSQHIVGQKQYELTDHLGDVLAAISDKRMANTYTPVSGGTLTTDSPAFVQTWKPTIVDEYDYYPFGQYIPARIFTDTNTGYYMFGFNGQMKTNEWAGIGNHTTAKFWEYETRTGRRDNLEPKTKETPWLSPYATNNDNPILNEDPNGDFPGAAAIGRTAIKVASRFNILLDIVGFVFQAGPAGG